MHLCSINPSRSSVIKNVLRMIQEAEAFLLLDDLHPCTNYSVSLATFLAIEDNTEGPVYTSEAVQDGFVTAANSDTGFQAGFLC